MDWSDKAPGAERRERVEDARERAPPLLFTRRHRSTSWAQPHAVANLGKGEARRLLEVHARREADNHRLGNVLEPRAEMGRALECDDGARVKVDAEMCEGLFVDRLLA